MAPVDVRQTFGLNRMDLMQREGQYPLPPQASKTILGVEFAGTVTKLGEGAKRFKVGDEVFGLSYGVRPAPMRGNDADLLTRRERTRSMLLITRRCFCLNLRRLDGQKQRVYQRTG